MGDFHVAFLQVEIKGLVVLLCFISGFSLGLFLHVFSGYFFLSSRLTYSVDFTCEKYSVVLFTLPSETLVPLILSCSIILLTFKIRLVQDIDKLYIFFI
jgi:hypothetical protein